MNSILKIKQNFMMESKQVKQELRSKRFEQIEWIKKLLNEGYKFVSRNEERPVGYLTVLSANGGNKRKEIIHSEPILDADFMTEQLELPVVGLSKENREKVNTRIWIVGGENSSIINLIKDQGYQVRVFPNGSTLEKEFSEKEEFECDLIITDLPYEIDFFIKDIHAKPGLSDLPVLVLASDEDTMQDLEYFESMGATYLDSYQTEEMLLSKIVKLTKKK